MTKTKAMSEEKTEKNIVFGTKQAIMDNYIYTKFRAYLLSHLRENGFYGRRHAQHHDSSSAKSDKIWIFLYSVT